MTSAADFMTPRPDGCLVLSTDPDVARSATFLRAVAAQFRIHPPSVEEIAAYHALRADGEIDASMDALDDFVDRGETRMSDYAGRIFGQLAHLDDAGLAQSVVARAIELWLESPCGPPPLVIVRHAGDVIVAPLSGAGAYTFSRMPTAHWPAAPSRAARRLAHALGVD